jgi:hypothetical protein
LNKYTAVAALKRVAALLQKPFSEVMLEQDISKKIFLLGKWKESKKRIRNLKR